MANKVISYLFKIRYKVQNIFISKSGIKIIKGFELTKSFL